MQADIKNESMVYPTKPTISDDYDPHKHRNVKNPTNNWQTFAHFLKASIGTGVLAMPSAFAHAGYVNGIILTLIIGGLALYCLHILISCMYLLCKRQRVPYVSFSEAMKLGLQQGPPFLRCLAPIATPFVDGFLAFYHFGICCVYVVFIAESIKQLFDEYVVVWDVRLHMCLLIVPLLLIFSIRNLKLLAPFSSAANLLLFVGFGIVLYYICTDLPPLSEREAFEDYKKFPTFFGTVLFALEAVGVILAIEENMATPRAYVTPCGIMNWGMAIVLSLYVFLGFFGYWKYGDEALGSVTLNIPQTEVMAQVVKIFFAITTYISYALQGYVTAHILWNKYLSKRIKDISKHTLYELLFRAVIVLLTFLCAIAIPDLSLFLSLVGSFCLSILGLIFPALLQICVQYEQGYGPFRIRLVINMLLLIFGFFGGIVGTYVSIVDIVEALS
ncbi:proton-coupled amino acid transporter-like protein CG1139 [Drosophila sulfurigaster albostrigata]|uniref:proton-coupled amino acid transporter-like protein CG1139 n=1 Tax=Drosophila sulfurigaster albostrigata TaxID=89887 RepID=UPI002D21D804|nr:proton-coupled amino acid transporter-like protein CG1139 [Drosophila sulfurigaster albostrigata]